jgi:excisionase family DNA binding protein
MMFTGRGTISRVEEDELLTVQSAATELGVSHMTIRRWIGAGHLKPLRPGREYLILRRDLERLRDPQARPQPGRPRKPADPDGN